MVQDQSDYSHCMSRKNSKYNILLIGVNQKRLRFRATAYAYNFFKRAGRLSLRLIVAIYMTRFVWISPRLKNKEKANTGTEILDDTALDVDSTGPQV